MFINFKITEKTNYKPKPVATIPSFYDFTDAVKMKKKKEIEGDTINLYSMVTLSFCNAKDFVPICSEDGNKFK